MKLTKSLTECNNINKQGGVNGFKIDIETLINQFAYNDEYPLFRKLVYSDDDKRVFIQASYRKFYDKQGEYYINIQEYNTNEDTSTLNYLSSRNFEKDFTTISCNRFSFVALKKLVNSITDLNIKTMLNEYHAFKIKDKKEVLI